MCMLGNRANRDPLLLFSNTDVFVVTMVGITFDIAFSAGVE